jgi:hypothetical protein
VQHAPRTETTIANPRDFYVNKVIKHRTCASWSQQVDRNPSKLRNDLIYKMYATMSDHVLTRMY